MPVKPLVILTGGLAILAAAVVGTGNRLDTLFGARVPEIGSRLESAPETTVAQGSKPVLAQADGNGAAQPASPKVDETALRYFAAKGDTKRLEAEIARLKALYPNWTPPKNPLAPQEVGDARLDAMWKLYSEGKYAEVRKAIADRIAADAGWKPPQDLLDRLNVAEAREQLVNASNLKQYDAVVRLGAENPSLLTCGDVDVLWRVAEAFSRTGRSDRARDAYLYVLKNCDKPDERLASVQKASTLLARKDLESLLAEERKTPDGQGEFDSVRASIARNSLAEAGKDSRLTVSQEDLALVEKLADRDKRVPDDLLLGWYYLRRDNTQSAQTWFRKAYEAEKSAATAQGLALSLVDAKQPAEAEDVLYQWRDDNADTRKVYQAAVANLLAQDPPPDLSPEKLDRMSRAIVATRSTPAAQQFGWYADALNQFRTAAQWFALVLSWTPADEPSAYGLALMRWKLDDRAGLREIQNAWAGRSERIAKVGEPERRPRDDNSRNRTPAGSSVTREAVTAEEGASRRSANREPVATREEAETAPAGRTRSTGGSQRPRSCSTTEDPSGLPPGQALMRGWCLMDINRPLEAAAAFDVALRGTGQTRSDAAYGQSLAYLRAGLVDMAAIASTKAPMNDRRSTEIRTALLEQQAIAAFEHRRYNETVMALEERARIAPERINLMVLRGYAYLKLRRFDDAEQMFRAAAATGDHDALKGLGDLELARDAR
jgi:tetratricopeptide (TPR) repeat protein